MKIISGGQTGVDRGALDAALEAGTPWGGWCPEGRTAEDGPIPARYPLQELPGAGYVQRTRKNVEDSDGTLIITFGLAKGGTARTLDFSQRLGKPHLVIDANVTSAEEGARQVLELLRAENIRRLNVAGPRASGEPGGYAYAFELISSVLETAGQSTGEHEF